MPVDSNNSNTANSTKTLPRLILAGAGQRESPREWNTKGGRGALPGTVDSGGHGLRKTRLRAVSGEEDHEWTGRAAGCRQRVKWPGLTKWGGWKTLSSQARSSRLSFPGLIVTAHGRDSCRRCGPNGQGNEGKRTNGLKGVRTRRCPFDHAHTHG